MAGNCPLTDFTEEGDMLFSLTLAAIVVTASAVLVVGGVAGAEDTERRAEPERATNVYNLQSYRAKRLAGGRRVAAPFDSDAKAS
jgi:hypothetical protein